MKHCKKCGEETGDKNYCNHCKKKYMEQYRMDSWYWDSRRKYMKTGEWIINGGRA